MVGTVGLFASTSLCNCCSRARFEGENTVEGTIRFYLAGLDSITIKGYAFLKYPFFMNLDNDDIKFRIDSLCNSAFESALSIWEEKIFFQKFAKDIKRARDDKSKTLRTMIDEAEARKKSKLLLNFSFTRKSDKEEEVNLPWVPHLPKSLIPVYEAELLRKQSGETNHTVLGALPLRDLVKTMFEKDSALIKTFK